MVINKSSVERGFGHGAIYASEVSDDSVESMDASSIRCVFSIVD
jgi:hypothetical protein